MSLGQPPLRPRPEGAQVVSQKDGIYSVPDMFLDGRKEVKAGTGSVHPLEFSEKHWLENQQKMDAAMLRNSQGIHAPLRLKMERNTALKMQRLPGLQSSNIMMDSLTGRLDTIDFEDILGCQLDTEIIGQPHAMMERRQGLL